MVTRVLKSLTLTETFLGQDNASLVGNFILQKVNSRHVRKYNTYQDDYEVRPRTKKLDTASLHDVRLLFEQLLKRTKKQRGLDGNDLFRIIIDHVSLTHPVSTKSMRVAGFDFEKLLNTIDYKELPILECTISTEVIKMPRGTGRLQVTRNNLDKKRSVIRIKNDDTMCLARAIVTALAIQEPEKWTASQLHNGIKKGRALQTKLARDLHAESGVSVNDWGNDFSDVQKISEHLEVQINILDAEQFNEVVYSSTPDRPKKIYLYKDKDHYDVITSMTAFNNTDYYCHTCKKGYTLRDKHRCPDKCLACYEYFPSGDKCGTSVDDKNIMCDSCSRTFFGQTCFDNHLKTRGKKGPSVCDTVFKCLECQRVLTRKDISPEDHVCGTTKCGNCKQWVVMSEHKCYMKPKSCKGGRCLSTFPSDHPWFGTCLKDDPCYACRTCSEAYMFFDLECSQDTGEHLINLAVAQDFQGVSYEFTNQKDFCEWVFRKEHKGYTFIAHNLKGYDGQFILNWCVNNGIRPETIYSGNKIMMLKVKEFGVRFIDSLNFIPQALRTFPKTFGLSEIKKGYFPHYFNKPCNQNYVGPLPSKSEYGHDQMSSKDRTEFLQWYDQKKVEGYEFDMQKELREYCRSDVDILRRSCLQLRENFIKAANIDPLQYVTIASVCMAIFRGHYLKPDTIAVVNNTVQTERFSKESIAWLDRLSERDGVTIQHALEGGEKKLLLKGTWYKVDGFDGASNTVYEFQGCFWHGCRRCYTPDTINKHNQIPMHELYTKTQAKNQAIRDAGYNLIEVWACELEKDRSFQTFKKGWTREVIEPLNPRDAFYGGRTNATKLLYRFKEGEHGKYKDVCSLYPTVQFYDNYPVGHPDKIFNPTAGPGALPWYGLVKCKVLPPRGLYHPVLPYRVKCQQAEKLMFPLCRTCAEIKIQGDCNHTSDERALIGTWTTDEVNKAIEKGYTVVKVYEVWHFEQRTNDLFKEYIKTFLKVKLETSPHNYKSDQEYKRVVLERLGIDLENIASNPGLRAIAKLCLNSLWGKFGQRNNMRQTKFVTDVAEFYKILLDDTLEVQNLTFLTDEMVEMSYIQKDMFVDNSFDTNIFVACFTTSSARLRLYGLLDYLGDQVLYFDTDSVVYIDRPGGRDIACGDMLGELTDELDGEVIRGTFASGGPKNYSFLYGKNKPGKGLSSKCTIKGFRLNYGNAQVLNHESMVKVIKDEVKELVTVDENKICRDPRNKTIVNRYQEKVYKFGYDKRAIRKLGENHIETVPYGY